MDWVTDGDGTLSSVMEERYEITNYFEDVVLSKEITAFIASKGLKMSPKKIGMEIRKLIRVADWKEEEKIKIYEVRTGNKAIYHGIRML